MIPLDRASAVPSFSAAQAALNQIYSASSTVEDFHHRSKARGFENVARVPYRTRHIEGLVSLAWTEELVVVVVSAEVKKVPWLVGNLGGAWPGVIPEGRACPKLFADAAKAAARSFRTTIDRHRYFLPSASVLFTGHGPGGAVAALLRYALCAAQDRSMAILFNPCRVGDQGLADIMAGKHSSDWAYLDARSSLWKYPGQYCSPRRSVVLTAGEDGSRVRYEELAKKGPVRAFDFATGRLLLDREHLDLDLARMVGLVKP